jgi:hypothetical protein
MKNSWVSIPCVTRPSNLAAFSSYTIHRQPQPEQPQPEQPQPPQHCQQRTRQLQHQKPQQQRQRQWQSLPQQMSSSENHNNQNIHIETQSFLHTQAANFGQRPSLYCGSASYPRVGTPTTSLVGANGYRASSQQQRPHESSPASTGVRYSPSSPYASYSIWQPTLPSESTASSAAQTPIQACLPDLRPIQPQTSYIGLPTLLGFGRSEPTGVQPDTQNDELAVSYVIESRRRRGSQLCAPDRKTAPTPGTTAAVTSEYVILGKDAKKRFSCLQCTKTYIRAKHLKRHLLCRKSSRELSPKRQILTTDRHRRSTLHVPSVQGYILSQ